MFLYSHWRSIPLQTRVLLSKQFGFSKVGSTHVSNNQVIDDGYKIEDVERALNVDAIQKYVGVDQTDMATLWELMIAKIEGRTEPVPEPVVITQTVLENTEQNFKGLEKPKRKYTRKPKAK